MNSQYLQGIQSFWPPAANTLARLAIYPATKTASQTPKRIHLGVCGQFMCATPFVLVVCEAPKNERQVAMSLPIHATKTPKVVRNQSDGNAFQQKCGRASRNASTSSGPEVRAANCQNGERRPGPNPQALALKMLLILIAFAAIRIG